MKAAADKLLKDAVSKGDVPGVVATATDAKGTTYEGGFGKRILGEADTQILPFADVKSLTLFGTFESAVYGHRI